MSLTFLKKNSLLNMLLVARRGRVVWSEGLGRRKGRFENRNDLKRVCAAAAEESSNDTRMEFEKHCPTLACVRTPRPRYSVTLDTSALLLGQVLL